MASYHDSGQKKVPRYPYDTTSMSGKPVIKGGMKYFQNNLGLIPLKNDETANDNNNYTVKNKKKKSNKPKRYKSFTDSSSNSDRKIFTDESSSSSHKSTKVSSRVIEAIIQQEKQKVKQKRKKHIFLVAVCVIVLFTIVAVLIIVYRDHSPDYIPSKKLAYLLNSNNHNAKKHKSSRRKSRKVKSLHQYEHNYKTEEDSVCETFSLEDISNNNNKMMIKFKNLPLEARLEAEGNHEGRTVLRDSVVVEDEEEVDPFRLRLQSGGFRRENANIVQRVKTEIDLKTKNTDDEFLRRIKLSTLLKIDDSGVSTTEKSVIEPEKKTQKRKKSKSKEARTKKSSKDQINTNKSKSKSKVKNESSEKIGGEKKVKKKESFREYGSSSSDSEVKKAKSEKSKAKKKISLDKLFKNKSKSNSKNIFDDSDENSNNNFKKRRKRLKVIKDSSLKSNTNINNNTLHRCLKPLLRNNTGTLQTLTNEGFKHFSNIFFNNKDESKASGAPIEEKNECIKDQISSTHTINNSDEKPENLYRNSNEKKLKCCFAVKSNHHQNVIYSLFKNLENKENSHGIQVLKNIDGISKHGAKKTSNLCNHNIFNQNNADIYNFHLKKYFNSYIFKPPTKPEEENVVNTEDHLSSLYQLSKLTKLDSTRFTQNTNDYLSGPTVDGYPTKAFCHHPGPYTSLNFSNNQHYFPENEINQFHYDEETYPNKSYIFKNNYDLENSTNVPFVEKCHYHGGYESSENAYPFENEHCNDARLRKNFYDRNEWDSPNIVSKNFNQNSVKDYSEDNLKFEKYKKQLRKWKLNEKRLNLKNIESYANKLEKIIEKLNEKKLHQKYSLDKLMTDKNHNNHLNNTNIVFDYPIHQDPNKNNSNGYEYLYQNLQNNKVTTVIDRFSQAVPSFQMPKKMLPKKDKNALNVFCPPNVYKENPFNIDVWTNTIENPLKPAINLKKLSSAPKTAMGVSGKARHASRISFKDIKDDVSDKENNPLDIEFNCPSNSKVLEKRIHRRANGMKCVIMLPNKKTGAKNLMVCEEDENPCDWDTDDPFIYNLCPQCRVKCCHGCCCKDASKAACKCCDEAELKRLGIGPQNANNNLDSKRSIYSSLRSKNVSINNANNEDTYTYGNNYLLEGCRVQPLSMPDNNIICDQQLFRQKDFTHSTKKVCPGCLNTMIQKSRRFVHIDSPKTKQVAYFQETCLFDSTADPVEGNMHSKKDRSKRNLTKNNPTTTSLDTSGQTLQDCAHESNDDSQKEKIENPKLDVKSSNEKHSNSEISSGTESETGESSVETSNKSNNHKEIKQKKMKKTRKQDIGKKRSKNLNESEEKQKVFLKNAETNTDEIVFDSSQQNPDYLNLFNFQPHLSFDQQTPIEQSFHEFYGDNQMCTEISPPPYDYCAFNHQICHYPPLNYPFMHQEPELKQLNNNSFILPELQANFGCIGTEQTLYN